MENGTESASDFDVGGVIDVSLVLPAFGVTSDIELYISEIISIFECRRLVYEIIVVDDGNYPPLTLSFEIPGVKVLRHQKNRGKGAALRSGFLASSGDIVGFVDADGEIASVSVGNMLDCIIDEDWAVAVGSKYVSKAMVSTSMLRSAGSLGFRWLVRRMVGVQVSDTQTGLKMFRREALFSVLDRTVSEGYTLDIELIVLLSHSNYKIAEVPIVLNKMHGSSITPRRLLEVVKELFRLSKDVKNLR